MQHFECDYLEGAHPAILQRLLETNEEKTIGYGCDQYCESARQKIREACKAPDAVVNFLVGGTQANATIIDTILRSYQGVISAETGHIAIHESGAIEAGGHKVITVPETEGKLCATDIDALMERFYGDSTHEHMVEPGLVYLSHPTEYGTLYSLDELQELRTLCNKWKLPLFMDGARLGYGLASYDTDVTLPDLAQLCDVFYIGGTKVGALFGEAVVFANPALADHFFTITKQHGGLLAKGRLLGLQFDTLFTDNLYLEISRNAIDMAEKLKAGLAVKGYQFHLDSPTNQQFVVLENKAMQKLAQKVTFSVWEAVDEDHTVVRFATSWATKKADVDALLDLL